MKRWPFSGSSVLYFGISVNDLGVLLGDLNCDVVVLARWPLHSTDTTQGWTGESEWACERTHVYDEELKIVYASGNINLNIQVYTSMLATAWADLMTLQARGWISVISQLD